MSATVKGGFWPENGVNTLVTAHTTSSARRRVSQHLGKKGQRALREVMRALDGVAPGAAALKTVAEISASSELGGLRTIESTALVNRVTTAGDVTDINADLLTLSTKSYTASPVANLDGNPLGTR